MLSYSIQKKNESSAILYLNNDLDIEATEIIEQQIIPDILPSKVVAIDFSNVPFVDSSGIGLLLTMVRNLKENNAKVSIVNLNAGVKEIFDLLQIHEILEI